MDKYILTFSSPEATLERVGGKGANLAILTRANFPVPTGFLVTTDAYHAFVESNQIRSQIIALAQQATLDDPQSLENTSAQIRTLFEHGTIPAEVGAEITAAYYHLSTQPAVAVRSSATAEDLPGLSFAGQQDTYLNVIGTDAVLDAVNKCWGSLWTARAIGYRARNGIPPDEVALAVVVQLMLASEASGILFTANPLTGRRDEIVIDASFGLGEAIVSGQVNPDHYVVNPHTWQIAERALGDKALAIIPRAGGGTEQVERPGTTEQALPDAQIVELARLAQRVAEHFGSPQDIEWAWANRQLYLLQARPITSL
jgi:rifampicin phosphotransferase